MSGKWNWKRSLASKQAKFTGLQPLAQAKRRRRNSPYLVIQELENRTLLSVTASQRLLMCLT